MTTKTSSNTARALYNKETESGATLIDMRDAFGKRPDPVIDRESGMVTMTLEDLQEMLAQASGTVKKQEQARTESKFKTNGILKPTAADPFRSDADFKAVARYLKTHGHKSLRARNYMLIILGTTLGLRCGDLLRLTVDDVYDFKARAARDRVMIIEEKTNKRSSNPLTKTARKAVEDYIEKNPGMKPEYPLFMSQKLDKDGHPRALDLSQVWRILNTAAKNTKVKTHVSTHTMRKTYGYSANRALSEAGVSSAVIMETLQAKYRHSSQDVTLRYLGLEQDNIDDVAGLVDNWVSGAMKK